MQRQSGILMPIFSLPSKYGIGDFGIEAYNFIKYLKKSGQKIWQILPLAPTGYGNSPYSSFASEALNPYYISIESLYKDGLLEKKDLENSLCDNKLIDYEFLYKVRFPLLRKAFINFDLKDKEFLSYLKGKKGLNYALFMALKEVFNGKPFYEWENGYKYCQKQSMQGFKKKYKSEILFWQFVQFKAQSQWLKLKAYANQNGISIMGDMPLYVALDSVEVWQNPSLFKLDSNFVPTVVAGVPPDYFCEDGQLWGNPVYNYENHQKDNFRWWTNRISNALKIYDFVRIDHFRGLDRYYEIPNGMQNARVGEWVEVPKDQLFCAILNKVDKNRIIAEDLGIIDDSVRDLLTKTGFAGMKVLSFAFNGESDNLYLPENITENSICYTGTHDNQTLLGLVNTFSEWDYNNLLNGVKNSLKLAQINIDIVDNISLVSAVIELGFYCASKIFIMPMQDVLKMDKDMRINTPGVVSDQNWSVKFCQKDFSVDSANYLKNLTKKHNR